MGHLYTDAHTKKIRRTGKNKGHFDLCISFLQWEEQFCKTDNKNNSSSAERVVRGAKAEKNSFTSEVEPCQGRHIYSPFFN
jgi:hypothetical protein